MSYISMLQLLNARTVCQRRLCSPFCAMVARGRFELPSMGLFLVRESKAHHWQGHRFRPLLVHYTTGLQETRVFGQVPISLLRNLTSSFVLVSEQ